MVSTKFKQKPYQMYYSNGVATALGANNASELKMYAAEKGIQEYAIFRNDGGFHSTTQEEFLVAWKGRKSYWAKRAEKEPALLDKKDT